MTDRTIKAHIVAGYAMTGVALGVAAANLFLAKSPTLTVVALFCAAVIFYSAESLRREADK